MKWLRTEQRALKLFEGSCLLGWCAVVVHSAKHQHPQDAIPNRAFVSRQFFQKFLLIFHFSRRRQGEHSRGTILWGMLLYESRKGEEKRVPGIDFGGLGGLGMRVFSLCGWLGKGC